MVWGISDVLAATLATVASLFFTGALYQKSKISRLKVREPLPPSPPLSPSVGL
jgi:hypothetical protein